MAKMDRPMMPWMMAKGKAMATKGKKSTKAVPKGTKKAHGKKGC